MLVRVAENAKLIIHKSFILFYHFGTFLAYITVGEHEAINCLEQVTLKSTSGDLTDA